MKKNFKHFLLSYVATLQLILFCRAAGTFQYIHENFTNAPSMDLGPETLQMMVQLMCAQARECLFAKSRLAFTEGKVGTFKHFVIYLLL